MTVEDYEGHKIIHSGKSVFLNYSQYEHVLKNQSLILKAVAVGYLTRCSSFQMKIDNFYLILNECFSLRLFPMYFFKKILSYILLQICISKFKK